MCGSGHIIGKRIIEYTPFNLVSNDKCALLVECGQHWASATGTAAMDTACRFLLATECVNPADLEAFMSTSAKSPPRAQMWDVTAGVTAQTDNFEFVENYRGMEVIPNAGTVIAYDGDTPVVTPYADCLLMMPNYKPGAGTRKLRMCQRVG